MLETNRATLDGVVLSFDLEQRKAIEVPAAIRSKCLEYIEANTSSRSAR